jgi:hypothetical protein
MPFQVKQLIGFGFLFIICFRVYSQAPQGFNYQAVARSNAGIPITNKTLGIRISILDGSSTGTVVYQEKFFPKTNNFGLFALIIGNGTAVSGNFNTISWPTGNKFLKVEMDSAGGSNYTTMGSSQLMAVPYSLYAGNAPSNLKAGTGIAIRNDTIINNAISSLNAVWTLAGSNIYNNNSGNVGIGATAPSSKLQINGIGTTVNTSPFQIADSTGTIWLRATDSKIINNYGQFFCNPGHTQTFPFPTPVKAGLIYADISDTDSYILSTQHWTNINGNSSISYKGYEPIQVGVSYYATSKTTSSVIAIKNDVNFSAGSGGTIGTGSSGGVYGLATQITFSPGSSVIVNNQLQAIRNGIDLSGMTGQVIHGDLFMDYVRIVANSKSVDGDKPSANTPDNGGIYGHYLEYDNVQPDAAPNIYGYFQYSGRSGANVKNCFDGSLSLGDGLILGLKYVSFQKLRKKITYGNNLSQIYFSGFDGSTDLTMASILAQAADSVATGSIPTKLVFQTGTNTSPSVLTTALTIGPDQSATFASNVVVNTSITNPVLTGGTASTSSLTLKSTSGSGNNGADIIFQVGNNGNLQAMRIYNSGNINFGDSSITGWAFGRSKVANSGYALQVGSSSKNGNGAYLTNGGTWTNASDRNKKENFKSLDSREILNRILMLQITRWNYKGETISKTHIGPVAQDFYRLFETGNDSLSISTIDPAGVALIGIQELKNQNDSLKEQVKALKLENSTIQKSLKELSAEVKAIKELIPANSIKSNKTDTAEIKKR